MGGMGKISSFLSLSVNISKTYVLSPVRPSLRPSDRQMYHRKTIEVSIMKFSPYGSPIPLVLAG